MIPFPFGFPRFSPPYRKNASSYNPIVSSPSNPSICHFSKVSPYHCHISPFPTFSEENRKNPKGNASVNEEKNKNYKKECISTEENKEDEDIPLFNLFGIPLYYDDVLILMLLFFLYQEDVKDPSLFIALILLLLN